MEREKPWQQTTVKPFWNFHSAKIWGRKTGAIFDDLATKGKV